MRLESVVRMVAVAALVAVALVVPSLAAEPPAPAKDHEWLKQFAGEWEAEAEIVVEPGKPAAKYRGTESTRILGGFWLVSEMKGTLLDAPFAGLMTVGYDTEKKKFVGSWVCSACDRLFKYEGTATGNVLTLETEGPHPATGKIVKLRDVVELKDKDHKFLTSYAQGEDGKWVSFMTMTARRKK
jgi:hypothetical protein